MRPTDGADVMAYLIPTGGWTITGDDFDSITYDEGVEPITAKQFKEGFGKADAARKKAEQDLKSNRQAILNRLGITAEELKTILE
jgi:hypothetical protein